MSGLSGLSAAPEPAVTEPRTSAVAPSAFGDDFRRFVNLTLTLAVTDFKLRYFGSVLGYLWSLMRPLLFFGILYLVFTKAFGLGRGVPGYPVQLLAAIVLWTFFMEATVGCVACMVNREALLRKMRFPRLVIPVSVVLTAMFNLATNLIPVFAFALASGHMPLLSWLELPLFVVGWGTLALGAGMLLSVLYVRFRDIQPIWDVTTQILFYASPIIWPIYPTAPIWVEHHRLVHFLMCSPIAAMLVQMYKAFLNPDAPSAAYYIGGAVRLIIPGSIIVIVFGLGLWLFNREAPRIAENL